MMDLHQILRDYLAIRRSLGFKLEREGALLPRFIAFLEEEGVAVITTTLALAWATRPTQATPKWWASRLGMVRKFAAYAHAIDSRNEVPSPDLLPYAKHRPLPYIYADHEVLALMTAADGIPHPFRAQTFRTLIGLLASTGMRVGEAIALDPVDLDFEEAVLTVRDSKFGTSRYLPLHPTTVQALQDYAASRNRHVRRSKGPAFFVSLAATRLIYQNVHSTFFRLVDQAGLAHRKPRRPRIHDLRHTFAVRTLIDWYRTGLDVEPRLPALSTYLGHVEPSGTYWYLSAVPELVGTVAKRLKRKLGG